MISMLSPGRTCAASNASHGRYFGPFLRRVVTSCAVPSPTLCTTTVKRTRPASTFPKRSVRACASPTGTQRTVVRSCQRNHIVTPQDTTPATTGDASSAQSMTAAYAAPTRGSRDD